MITARIRWTIAASFVLVLVLGLRVAGAAGLDELKNTTPAERAKAQTFMMKGKLGLSEVQLPKIAAINEKYAQQMEPLIKGSEGPLMKMRDARSIEAAKEAELKTVLSPEQFTKFEAGKEEMKDQLLKKIQEQRAKK